MGNSASSSGRGHQDEIVDYGYLSPQGVYTGPRDWNHAIVSQLICQRKLAPFYRPLEEYNDSWDDDQILAARKNPPDTEGETVTRTESATTSSSVKSSHSKRPSALKEPSKPEATVYRGAIECPICFLYYPPNINYSRCCDQAICTECFVQIKRNEPTTTHLVSEPAACPYCVQDNFGVIYRPPPWRAGIGSDALPSVFSEGSKGSQQFLDNFVHYPTHKRRQKSYSADSPEVVTTDQIRPDWEAKLAAVRAAVARRANRRIIMRQVGDRLIPVGVTSGRVHALGQDDVSTDGSENGGSRRMRRRQHGQGLEQFVGLAGQDLEELMLMEAMRLSLLEHEEQQRREAAERRKQEAAAAETRSETPSSPDLPSEPGPSTAEARHNTNPETHESPLGTIVPSTSSQPTTDSMVNDISKVHDDSRSRSRSRTPISPSTNDTAIANEVLNTNNCTPSLNSYDDISASYPANETLAVDEPRRDIHASLPDSSTSSISLNAPTDSTPYEHLPSSPESTPGSLLDARMDPQNSRKFRPSVENGRDLAR
ncbi:hypothetical protein AX17_005118 [Amanita inopinata Kibby_2008]|nr:hypothetical protein AX17_005118 [Amanita inopinata Kibby_2008]